MASIEWCKGKEGGLEISQPNLKLAASYIGMAEESIRELKNVKSAIWKAAIVYYSYYYSLYALMIRIGIKCEIHSCSLEFMRQFLNDFYNEKDRAMIEKSFSVRIDLQYYSNRPVDAKVIEETKAHCSEFFIKTKETINSINENQINDLRHKLKKWK